MSSQTLLTIINTAFDELSQSEKEQLVRGLHKRLLDDKSRNLSAAILSIMRYRSLGQTEWSPGEIRKALTSQGLSPTSQGVSNALKRLTEQKKVARVRWRVYALKLPTKEINGTEHHVLDTR